MESGYTVIGDRPGSHVSIGAVLENVVALCDLQRRAVSTGPLTPFN